MWYDSIFPKKKKKKKKKKKIVLMCLKIEQGGTLPLIKDISRVHLQDAKLILKGYHMY